MADPQPMDRDFHRWHRLRIVYLRVSVKPSKEQDYILWQQLSEENRKSRLESLLLWKTKHPV